MIAEAYERTRQLLSDNKDKLGAVCTYTPSYVYIYRIIDNVY